MHQGGPRHLVFHPHHKIAYLINELNADIGIFYGMDSQLWKGQKNELHHQVITMENSFIQPYFYEFYCCIWWLLTGAWNLDWVNKSSISPSVLISTTSLQPIKIPQVPLSSNVIQLLDSLSSLSHDFYVQRPFGFIKLLWNPSKKC